jgi:hypothetical protein
MNLLSQIKRSRKKFRTILMMKLTTTTQKMLLFIHSNSRKRILLLIFRQFVIKKNWKKNCKSLKEKNNRKDKR